jgi:hypothetical protein
MTSSSRLRPGKGIERLKRLPVQRRLKLLVLASTLLTTGAADPLTVTLQTRDAERFAAVFAAAGGKPDAGALQRGYLDDAGDGVRVFTPYRIENAQNLAAAVAREPERYAYAIKTCLPLTKSMTADMRSVYLAYRGLTPNRPLPDVHLVFGAATSGGTANRTAQVIGLEVMCGPGTTPERFRAVLRAHFAHETVHSWQNEPGPAAMADPLLLYALREGVPDYLASLVTGAPASPERETWGRPREAWLWTEFQRDRAIVKAGKQPDGNLNDAANKAVHRWIGNYGDAPKGWPFEAGYWVGMQIAAAYVDRATDKRAAIDALIELRDPVAILEASGYANANKVSTSNGPA